MRRVQGSRTYPISTDNVFLGLIALREPVAFQLLSYGYATLWFTTPFFPGSLVLSVLTISMYHLLPTSRSRPLPCYPATEAQPSPSLVLGEAHFVRTLGPAPNPEWVTIPQRRLYTGVLILGAVGTEETSACMYPHVDQLLRWRAEDRISKSAASCWTSKATSVSKFGRCWRAQGVSAITSKSGSRAAFVRTPAQRSRALRVGYAIGTLLTNLFGKSKEPFWQQAYTDLLKFVISQMAAVPGTFVGLGPCFAFVCAVGETDPTGEERASAVSRQARLIPIVATPEHQRVALLACSLSRKTHRQSRCRMTDSSRRWKRKIGNKSAAYFDRATR